MLYHAQTKGRDPIPAKILTQDYTKMVIGTFWKKNTSLIERYLQKPTNATSPPEKRIGQQRAGEETSENAQASGPQIERITLDASATAGGVQRDRRRRRMTGLAHFPF